MPAQNHPAWLRQATIAGLPGAATQPPPAPAAATFNDAGRQIEYTLQPGETADMFEYAIIPT